MRRATGKSLPLPNSGLNFLRSLRDSLAPCGIDVAGLVRPRTRAPLTEMKFVMNHSTFATLALTAAALISSGATASGFTGTVVVASPVRTCMLVRQTGFASNFLSLQIKVLMRSGVYEYPQFNVVTFSLGYVVETTGSCYRIVATVVTGNQTRFQIFHSGLPNVGVQSIEFGGLAQELVFDRTSPNPGTSTSDSGRDVQYFSGSGIWSVTAEWRNPIRIATASPLGDSYSGLKIRFSTTFRAGDHLYFDVDTDIAA